MKRELKKSVVYGLYALSFALLVGGIFMIGFLITKTGNKSYQYVSKSKFD